MYLSLCLIIVSHYRVSLNEVFLLDVSRVFVFCMRWYLFYWNTYLSFFFITESTWSFTDVIVSSTWPNGRLFTPLQVIDSPWQNDITRVIEQEKTDSLPGLHRRKYQCVTSPFIICKITCDHVMNCWKWPMIAFFLLSGDAYVLLLWKMAEVLNSRCQINRIHIDMMYSIYNYYTK